jgi:hypothetical protein
MAKRGSVEAFKEAEARRQERINSSKASNTSDARKQKRDAFNAKVKAINESRVNKSSLDRFKKAEADRKARVVSVNKMNPNSPKAKRLLKEQADAKKDLPKSVAPSPMAKDRVASAAAIGVASTAKADPIASPKKESTATPKKSVDLSGFGAAFKKARAEGVGTKFAYDDKMYSAVTKDDISRSGKSSLQDFLNSTKRTETTIAKAPGQIVQKKSGGEISDTVKRRLKDAMEKRNKTLRDISATTDTERIRKAMEGREDLPGVGNIQRPMPSQNTERIRKAMEGREDLPGVGNRQRPMPSQRPPIPRQRPIPRGTMPKERKIRKSKESEEFNRRMKDRSYMPNENTYKRISGAAMTDNEMRSMMDQISKPESMDRFKSGGSVMARGCKLGRKKPTKLY